ncbi:MAG: hypothetical protein KKH44_08475 [Bacteroidetes bacterium]|nr:hypothetical protein [Bacteroidota bacterium]
MKSKKIVERAGVKGFFRLNIVDHSGKKPSVVGDTGWCENQITNAGYSNFIIGPMVADAASSVIGYAALGTGSVPASNATGLAGELVSANCRFALAATVTGTKSAQFTGSLNSNVYQATAAINNVGLFQTNAITAGTIAAGNTYATSTLQTNQTVNLTYSITFA